MRLAALTAGSEASAFGTSRACGTRGSGTIPSTTTSASGNFARRAVTAWVCAADHQAFELVAALEQRGFRVPADVSVTGFDGVKPFENKRSLSTVMIPYREIGYTGAKRLHDLMRRRFVSPQHILVGNRIRHGDTTACPP